MLSSSSITQLLLHRIPAGNRLDFSPQPGLFAYVYRRHGLQCWQCVAHNACSPFIDRMPPASNEPLEYVVCFCDAQGSIRAATALAQADQAVSLNLAVNHAGQLVKR
ncbi:hypothetical protein [Hymenobacter pini]|uniref:hypothetical protein n=1 Tax=Hymenobacter pini TaxID=2880879 RepID=UPI001CF28512|nr:hypothetical protein [Hymenobacter pini]MCA8829512.1 hypothetical protein [Hymenobacter pini]